MKTLFRISDCRFRIVNFWNRGSSVLSLTLISLSAYSLTLNAQIYSDDDIEICNEKIQLSVDKNLAEKPISDVFIEMSESFIGTDYLAYSLETDGEEQLVVNLSGLDCTTFVEYSLALSRCIKKDTITSDDFLEELQLIRYRDGEINGYPSRLHYFSDWITNNVAKKVVEDETLQMGGKPIKFNLNFMSTHPDSYKQLIENLDLIPVIKIQEDEISSRTYYYIPKDEFESKEKFINSGDIIAITTTVDGLDIGHLGIAVRNEDGRIHLLHAPSPNTKVHITELTLADYLMKYKRHSGVIVLRVLEPTNLSH